MLHAENVPLIFRHHAENSPQLADKQRRLLRMMRKICSNTPHQAEFECGIPHDAEYWNIFSASCGKVTGNSPHDAEFRKAD